MSAHQEIVLRGIGVCLSLFVLAACADEVDDGYTPLLRAEAGLPDTSDTGMAIDMYPAPGPLISGTFTVLGLDGHPAASITAKTREVENTTDGQGRVRLAVDRNRPFLLDILLPNAPPHSSQGMAGNQPFSHTILVLTDDDLERLFAALPTPPMDGSGVLVVEAPVGASVYAGGQPGFLWGPEGPQSGDIVAGDGPRLVLFPGISAGNVSVETQSPDEQRCAPLPAGASKLDVRVSAGRVTHVAFRCP